MGDCDFGRLREGLRGEACGGWGMGVGGGVGGGAVGGGREGWGKVMEVVVKGEGGWVMDGLMILGCNIMRIEA